MRSPRLPFRHLARLTTAFVLLGAALPLHADDSVVYDARPTETPGFFHRVGDFFRDLFATEQSLSPRPTPPRPTAPRYNLDLPAPGTGYGFGNNYRSHDGVTSANTESEMTHTHVTPPPPKKSKATKHTASTEVATSEPAPKSTESSKPKHSPPSEPADKREPSSSAKVTSDDSPKHTHTASAPSDVKNVPSGTRTSKTTRVKSPYPPYNELDVSGMSSGSLAMDPTTQKVFRVP